MMNCRSQIVRYSASSSSVSQIIKELCSFSSYSSHFCHKSFVKKAFSSQNMNKPIGFSTQDIIRSVFFVPIRFITFHRTVTTYKKKIYKLTLWLIEPGGSMQHLRGLSNNSYRKPYILTLIPVSLRSILILFSHLHLPKGLFQVGLLVKILKALLLSSILATCPY